MSTEHVTTELRDRVLILRLNRPDKKNALTQAMYTALADELKQANENPTVRCILLTGTDDCFCSGNDIADFLQMKTITPSDDVPVLRFMKTLAHVAKPVVAAINGPAIGVGTTILLHVDLAYAGEKTRFQLPFVNIGICPEYASTYFLPRMIGHVKAAELTMLGEPFTAAEALDYRLINAVLPDAEVFEHALAKAQRLAQQPPAALRTTKALLKRWRGDLVDEIIPAEAVHFMSMLQDAEAKEALGAFLQKRKPDFSSFD
ncbi:enoyl-CoA hydratase [Sinimarinibacterium sp. CAU 1509]|uniref:enoyl-CoA hydratase n=1 Tax=Sinimarinibacterium sp. CAU 1509 TaxID=2562283 RepID=UPI0010ACD15D|nr:enoyl-CoA hydratase [Sinimarinibacterium sp. CAU 1509]TJY62820.1 enoyl-CoA hydratase [Sinimarinibacterium sp. CAU 1509]